MKHLHSITINTLGKKPCDYSYQFGNTKDICIQISSSGISIKAHLTKIYDKSEMFTDGTYLFSDAIKKSLLLYLITYNKPLTVKALTVQIDDEKEQLDIKEKTTPLIYSMISSSLRAPINKAFLSKPCVDGILSQTKSSYDSRMAALFALLCGKSKQFETERFIYFWMSLNGLYGYYSSIVGKEHNNTKISKEYKQIRYFQSFYSLGNETISDDSDKKRIANETMSIIKQSADLLTQDFLQSEEGKTIEEKTARLLVKKDGTAYNISPYGYLLTQLPYYLRCNLFHGNKPIKLFCLEDDLEIQCLRSINEILENFLDNELFKWFDCNYINESVVPQATSTQLI